MSLAISLYSSLSSSHMHGSNCCPLPSFFKIGETASCHTSPFISFGGTLKSFPATVRDRVRMTLHPRCRALLILKRSRLRSSDHGLAPMLAARFAPALKCWRPSSSQTTHAWVVSGTGCCWVAPIWGVGSPMTKSYWPFAFVAGKVHQS